MNDPLGTIQILRNQKGGWVGKAKCLRLLTRWVGVAKCLRNHKNFLKKSKLTSNKDYTSLQIFEVEIHTR